MDNDIRFYVGLDVHKDSTAVAVCEPGREASRFVGSVGPDLQQVLKVLHRYGNAAQVSVVYEAGPTGYGLQRALAARGYRCEIIAPSLIPRRAGERVKTDRRDCARLAELSRAGELKAIWVPDAAHEAIRNLWRAREDAVDARVKARQQLKAFLLRAGRLYEGKTAWTKMHERWIADQRFDEPADQIALTEYQLAVQAADERVRRLTNALEQSAADWQFAPTVAALRALRGIDTVSAIGLVCEIGDINRFATARQLMGYLGLVPSKHSSGGTVRRGSITKTGNAHARRLLTEAAWNYRFPARMSNVLRMRSRDLAPEIRNHAWKAQLRLCARFSQLAHRGMQPNKVCVAVARELAGFIWAIARQGAIRQQ
ncbi:IS110 family RNA-guided transposase [Castellaniella sp. WN]